MIVQFIHNLRYKLTLVYNYWKFRLVFKHCNCNVYSDTIIKVVDVEVIAITIDLDQTANCNYMMMRCSDTVRVFFKVLIFCLVCGKQASALSINDFYPFGPLNGDSELPKGDNTINPVTLAIVTFPAPSFFYGESFGDIAVSK